MKSDLQFKQDKKIIKEYLRDVKRNLPFYDREEKEFLRILSSAMYDFAETSSDEAITMTSLVERFGTTRDCVDTYVKTYMDHLSDDDANRALSSKRHLKLLIVGLAVLSVISICSAVLSHKKLQESKLADIRSETIVIKEYEPYPVDATATISTKAWISAESVSTSTTEMGD